MRVLSLLVVFPALVTLSSPTRACSVQRPPPTNFELVAAADRIVVVRAPKAPPELTKPDASPAPIAMRVERVLKGAAATPDEVITVNGVFHYLGRSPDKRIDTPRPGVMRGMCVAWDYKSEGTFVLMLKKTDKGWELETKPLSRSNEEIDPTGDVWEEAITTYVRIASLPKASAAKERARVIAVGEHPHATLTQRRIADDLATRR